MKLMFISMVLKTIPRSLRAGIALLVMLLALGRGSNGLMALVGVDSRASGSDKAVTILCLIVGTVAAIAFYYFQARDGETKVTFNPLDTLNSYQEAQIKEQRLHQTATPVFSSQDGEIKPKPETPTERKPL